MLKILILICTSSFLFALNQYFTKLFNLYDIPDNIRKLHKVKTPLTGGLLIFLSFFLYILIDQIFFQSFFQNLLVFNSNFFTFYIGFILFFVIGFFDDKYNLNANLKIILFITLILILLILDKDLHIRVIKLAFIEKDFSIGNYSFIWTSICFLLFINAVNMFDGVNGQTGLYILFCLIYLNLSNSYLNQISYLFLVPLIFFLYFNLKNKCFIGNSGTYSLSFVVAYLFIKSYNLEIFYTADEIVLIMLLPGLDLIRLFALRIMMKRNPFSPDREHLHHYLQNKFRKKYIFLLSNLFIVSLVVLANYTNEFLYIIILKIFLYTLIILFLKKSKKINA